MKTSKMYLAAILLCNISGSAIAMDPNVGLAAPTVNLQAAVLLALLADSGETPPSPGKRAGKPNTPKKQKQAPVNKGGKLGKRGQQNSPINQRKRDGR